MKKLTGLICLFFLIHTNGITQNNATKGVLAVTERLRLAMEGADSLELDMLVSDKLSYGHSNGRIEDKKAFIYNLLSKQSDFVNIRLTDQTLQVNRQTAIVRHNLDAITNDNGKPGEAHLHVLLVWQKEGKYWKLLARQAVKRPV